VVAVVLLRGPRIVVAVAFNGIWLTAVAARSRSVAVLVRCLLLLLVLRLLLRLLLLCRRHMLLLCLLVSSCICHLDQPLHVCQVGRGAGWAARTVGAPPAYSTVGLRAGGCLAWRQTRCSDSLCSTPAAVRVLADLGIAEAHLQRQRGREGVGGETAGALAAARCATPAQHPGPHRAPTLRSEPVLPLLTLGLLLP
jgi:hypothetical protein